MNWEGEWLFAFWLVAFVVGIAIRVWARANRSRSRKLRALDSFVNLPDILEERVKTLPVLQKWVIYVVFWALLISAFALASFAIVRAL